MNHNNWYGINIEANPTLIQKFNKDRPHDINLNIGVSDKKDTLNKALVCIEKPFEKIKHYEKMYVGPTKEQEVLRTFCGT